MGYLFENEAEGNFGRSKVSMVGAPEEEKSLLSGFKDIFSSFQVKGGQAVGLGREGAAKPELTEE